MTLQHRPSGGHVKALAALCAGLMALAACSSSGSGTASGSNGTSGAAGTSAAGDSSTPGSSGGGSAAGGSGAAGSGSLGTLKMAGTASYAVTELAFPLAEEKGYFAQAGLKIQSTSTEQTASALASGSVDVAIGSPGSLVGGLNKGLNITIIGGVSDEFAETWAVRPSLQITSLSQLKGKKLGISSSGSAGDLSISLLAKHFGWGPNDYTRVSLGGLDGILAGMKSGAIDAFAWPPIATFELQAEGEAKVLIDNFPKIVGDLPVDVIAVSTKTLDSRPKAVKAFCTAFYKASALLKKDPSAGISPEVKGGDRKNGPALLKALKFGAPLLSTNGTLSDQAMNNIVEAAKLTTQGAQSLTVDVLKQHYKPCESI